MTIERERIIRLPTVLNRTGLSRSTLYRKIREGTFPKQIPISVNGAVSSMTSRTCWPRLARSAARRQQTPASPRLSMTRQKMSQRKEGRERDERGDAIG